MLVDLSSEINWLAFGRDDIRRNLTQQEQELFLHPDDLSQVHDEAIRSLIDGRWGEIKITRPFSWDFSQTVDRAVPYRMHSFIWQMCLMDEFFRTGDIFFLEQLILWVFDWINKHPTADISDPWAWHDDATGRRALYFGIILVAFEKVLSEEQIHRLRESLAMHASVLRNEEFYRLGHNHGFYQDLALAAYALSCGRDAAYWSRLSEARSHGYLCSSISEENVHLEHSPNYHVRITRGIAWLEVVYKQLDVEYSAVLKAHLKGMALFSHCITMPDGCMPSVGDSTRKALHEFLFDATEGIADRHKLVWVFQHAGYGVIRSDYSTEGFGTWMMLMASTHGEVHKHNDDLNFLLYHDGGEVITEAGSRDYNYADPLTEYCYSSYGHNVLFVNGEGWGMKPTHLPLLEKDAYETGIVAWEDTPALSSVTGRQIRFPGVIQDRTLRYDRLRERVTVEDRITLDHPAKLRLIYHLAPDVEAECMDGKSWSLFRNGAPIAVLSFESSLANIRTEYRTISEPPWRTEIFWGKSNPRPSSLLTIDCSGETGLNIICARFTLQ